MGDVHRLGTGNILLLNLISYSFHKKQFWVKNNEATLSVMLIFRIFLTFYDPRISCNNVNFALEQAMKFQRGSRGIALLFL